MGDTDYAPDAFAARCLLSEAGRELRREGDCGRVGASGEPGGGRWVLNESRFQSPKRLILMVSMGTRGTRPTTEIPRRLQVSRGSRCPSHSSAAQGVGFLTRAAALKPEKVEPVRARPLSFGASVVRHVTEGELKRSRKDQTVWGIVWYRVQQFLG